MFKAEVILASRNTFGDRITTMLVTYPRIIHAEMCRHRMFSRNTASSRAIPFKKMLQAVKNDPFIPLGWIKEHKGMQGFEYFTNDDIGTYTNRRDLTTYDAPMPQVLTQYWLEARDSAIREAQNLSSSGLTKQLCNRLLEPFGWITELITGTEWENFFALRIDPQAEIHIQKLARLMLAAYNSAPVQDLKPGEWHIPYGDKVDLKILGEWMMKEHLCPGYEDTYETELEYNPDGDSFYMMYLQPQVIKIATARCAQTSYTVFGEGEKPMDYEHLIGLHDRLNASHHGSPLEHCARSMDSDDYSRWVRGHSEWSNNDYANERLKFDRESEGLCANYKGFIQYRKMFKGENLSYEGLAK